MPLAKLWLSLMPLLRNRKSRLVLFIGRGAYAPRPFCKPNYPSETLFMWRQYALIVIG